MRDLSRRDRVAIGALAEVTKRHPQLQRALVEDYVGARRHIHELRAALDRRLAAMSRHPDEPGSKSAVACRDGLAPYGTEDTTGFAPGCVF